MADAAAVFEYARSFADAAEKSGRGTQFPTLREAAKRFRCRQQEVMDAVESADASSIPGADYFGIAVGIRTGAGYGEFDSIGDYRIEAYRHD